jgi:molybdopterin converting factor small subunit
MPTGPRGSGRVVVRLYAQAREAAGAPRIELPVPPEGTSLERLLEELVRGRAALRSVLRSCRFARNGSYVSSVASRIAPGDEVAVHPPFSGG